MYSHRPGKLKQQNKPHKTGRHETRGTSKRKTDGKAALIERISVRERTSSKQDRKNKGKQILQKKKEALISDRRQNHAATAPKIIGLISLSSNSSAQKVWDAILQQVDVIPRDNTNQNNTVEYYSKQNAVTVYAPTWRQRFTLLRTADDDLHGILDIGKVADLLLVLLPTTGVDARGEQFVSMLKGQGLPAVIGVLQGMDSVPAKQKNNIKRQVHKYFSTAFPEEPKLLTVDSLPEATQLVRYMANTAVRHIQWRERRPYLVTDHIHYVPNEESETTGTLSISGFLRGHSLDVNNLVHIPDFGDFQLKQIDAVSDPYPFQKNSKRNSNNNNDQNSMEIDSKLAETVVLATADPSQQETLETENEPDYMGNEQTWPTEEELQEADARIANSNSNNNKGKSAPKQKKRVPKGTSAYQAAWIVDEESGHGDNHDDEEEEEEEYNQMEDHHNQESDMKEEEEENESDEEEEDEMEDLNDDTNNNDSNKKSADDMFNEEELNALAGSDREKRHMRSEEDMEFPDEVDVPEDQAARLRFQKYRGLKSLRTSPWDPKENLPTDYARIFQFANFARTKKRVLAENLSNVSAEQYVTLHIKNVPKTVVESISNSNKPLLVCGLLKYENKTSVLNFNVMKHSAYTEPVQSKDPLVVHCGFRRYLSFPVFSENTLRSDKHKYERFLHPSHNSVATVYGPITFPNVPVILLNPSTNQLVAIGSLISVDPDRIILKKIILTGHPLKIHKSHAVIRDMFYNADDIKWFKPVELWTKYGRTGHIKESIGTHGYMKCVFDNQIKANDTVCMSLYKRIFPVWTNVPSDKLNEQPEAHKKRLERLTQGFSSVLKLEDLAPLPAVNLPKAPAKKQKSKTPAYHKNGERILADAPIFDDLRDDDDFENDPDIMYDDDDDIDDLEDID